MADEKKIMTVEEMQKEIATQTNKQEVMSALLATTFKGLDANVAKQAILAGMIRGFTFKDFLEKNVYAISYGGSYNLVTSIDYSRKIGMRSGVIGVSEPKYEFDENKKPVACTITVKRRSGQDIGEYTAKVYFSEYTTGRNQWLTKPLTMIAKVAEMHALRKACPEELAQNYSEEEMEKEIVPAVVNIDIAAIKLKIEAITDFKGLKALWQDELTADERNNPEIKKLLEEKKKDIEVKKIAAKKPAKK